MDKGIYTALSGGIAKGHELELIANNLANANTPGFKRDTGTFNEYLMELRRIDSVPALQRELTALTMLDGRPPGDKSFVEMDGVYTDYRQGAIERTGRKLDFALEGDGFFEVNTRQGVLYTRQGNLNLTADGTLVTMNGYPVLQRGEAPPEQRTIRLGQGPVEATPDGIVLQGGRPIATLSIQEFHEIQWLEKSGNAYFKNIRPENLKTETGSRIHQGFLEGSNVNPVVEMTKLIEATRAYEAHMQAVKTYHDIDNKTANEIVRDR